MVKIEKRINFASHLIELTVNKKVETEHIFDHKNSNKKSRY